MQTFFVWLPWIVTLLALTMAHAATLWHPESFTLDHRWRTSALRLIWLLVRGWVFVLLGFVLGTRSAPGWLLTVTAVILIVQGLVAITTFGHLYIVVLLGRRKPL